MGETLLDDLPALLNGLGNSLLVSAIGITVSVVLGIALGAARNAGVPVLSQAIAVYVNVFRCTPLLVQIFMLYFALPEIGIRLSPFQTSWIALALWGAAYHTEIFRAGFKAVPPAEILAARALGMPARRTFLDVTLPLGLRATIPAATTMAIGQFRSSSFMVVVGYQELTYVANGLVSQTFRVFEIFGMAALMYFLTCTLIGAASRGFETWLRVPGTRTAR
ncbi:amino acid ABC transporter permease [Antarcticirhabdus aurantiaca]|uniref:Amino acid ABC transporter permease n=1 Tax=Antarcticirhabdus aurantiaca TaxID=2606717 RepID=A0ACD4NRS5_9HYPH|nr:amino acid ABC transporter permease [Antarcticirhabdus aurantiaca]WAJ29398.1 amino acid ABC transporter permease [Jeongeuplla avenae]